VAMPNALKDFFIERRTIMKIENPKRIKIKREDDIPIYVPNWPRPERDKDEHPIVIPNWPRIRRKPVIAPSKADDKGC